MRLEEASSHIGRPVVYRSHEQDGGEHGVITSVNAVYVFVRYGASQHSTATNPRDLELAGIPT